jgi:hypothetical protein
LVGEFSTQGFVERRDAGAGCFSADLSLGWRSQEANNGNCGADGGRVFHAGSNDLFAGAPLICTLFDNRSNE